ncbi:MAG: hypothetical protein H3C29_01455 [Simplicispira suum]|uniref:hypothetical protein n=1 Tax=Simplicispira suum TaxID=2109915 RepID=UPI001C6A9DC4|nr:hypothetical protein [Simplicispira suum]MBW7831857.1 hypothetical protein [Simplicispira suum]
MTRAAAPLRWLLAGLRTLAVWLLALLVLFEEWGWEPLQRLLARLGRWPGLRWVEGRVRALQPWAALAAFGVPTLLLLPIKLLALWAIGNGQVLLGAAVVIAAKIVGTAVVARLFTLTQPALMRLAWFAIFYVRWIALKTALLARARASWPWRAARVLRRRARRWWRRTGLR